MQNYAIINVDKVISLFDRKDINKRYYREWHQVHDIWDYIKKGKTITSAFLIDFYNEYRSQLIKFINELDAIQPNVTKIDFKPNRRQTGGYRRCVLEYPDKGWEEKYNQFVQGYKELMVDFIFYSDDLEYEEISLSEIQYMKKMAYFLICRAEINIHELLNENK